jgi:hypothetical protein
MAALVISSASSLWTCISVRKNVVFFLVRHFYNENRTFAKTGPGQT